MTIFNARELGNVNQLSTHLRIIATVLSIHLSDCPYKNWKN